ncbi:MAG: BrnT family toxin [Kiritimatiellaeota bacterium]|nr:BrnT family toxin [Kiritimatiellota bacterium]
MRFEWDQRKAARNLLKHAVSFQEGASVLADPLSITYHDPDHSVMEPRFITVGISPLGRVLMVAHTDRGANIRIISARQTTRQERRHYEEGK